MTNEEAIYELEAVISDIELAGVEKGDEAAIETLRRVAKHLFSMEESNNDQT